MQKFVLIDGKKVEINIFGSNKKVIILLPGWTHNFQFETKFIQELTKTYKVVTISYPGYSESEENRKAKSMDFLAKILNEVIKQLELKNYKIVGFSMGTQVILKYLDNYHDKAKVILISATTKPLTSDVPNYGKVIIKSKNLIKIIRKIGFVKRFLVDTACGIISSVTEGSKKSGKFESNNVSLNGAYDTLFAPLNSFTDPKKFVKQIEFIFGDKEVLQDNLDKSLTYKTIKNAGHGAFNTHYKEIAKMIT